MDGQDFDSLSKTVANPPSIIERHGRQPIMAKLWAHHRS